MCRGRDGEVPAGARWSHSSHLWEGRDRDTLHLFSHFIEQSYLHSLLTLGFCY